MDTKGLVRALGEESLLRHVSGPLLLSVTHVVTKVCVCVCVCKHTYIKCGWFFLTLQVLSINEEGLRRCEENTKVFGRPIRYTPRCCLVVAPPLPLIGQVEFKPYCIHPSRPLRSTGHKFCGRRTQQVMSPMGPL